jgi:dihydroflavonol-4-reductase
MKVCVTGATGFIGAHLAAKLAAKGHQVRVTYRDRGRLEVLDGIPVEPVMANALDRRSMRRALEGCELVFHTAGLVASRPAANVWRTNAGSPRIVIESAADVGARRVVLTSSVAAIGPARDGRAADEGATYPALGLGLIYPDSKHEGEMSAFSAGERNGVEVVAVNPSYVLGAPFNGALSLARTSTRIVANYLRGRLPAIVDSYTNLVDVEDVAEGHLLAADRGRPGERYILGGQNLRWSDVLDRIARISKRRHPLIVLPPETARAADLLSRFPIPILPLEGIRLMAPDWRYSSNKAKRELGYQPRTASNTLKRTVNWYLDLLASGDLPSTRPSSFDFMGAGVRAADRTGLLVPLRAVGRLAGRRMVI